ncbi:hypothetical protein RhiirA4_547533 [Rhizophagus irregularis]|uniref:Uncharacterized protein n=1 Tax=Rhizophagus irregularis TaxID=588596 RepID=A0A2I1H2R2_9GLOM|nr:hypothetical protein RhiirA4_547533 [Rhizophagus irregularis]
MKLHLALKYSKVTYNIKICMQYHQSKDSNNSTKLTASANYKKIIIMIHELNIQSFNKGGVVTFSGKFCYWNNYDGDNPLFEKKQTSDTFVQSSTSAAAEIAKSFSTKSKKRENSDEIFLQPNVNNDLSNEIQADNTIIQDDNTTVQDNKHQEQREKSSKKMRRKTERKTSK